MARRDRLSGPDGLLEVVTTVSPITNIAQNIGGDKIDSRASCPKGPIATRSGQLRLYHGRSRMRTSCSSTASIWKSPRRSSPIDVGDGVPIVELGDMTISKTSTLRFLVS